MIRQLTKCIREYKAPTIWTLVLILAEVAIDVIIPFETANLINEVKAGAELGGIVRVGLVLVLLAMISLVCGGLYRLQGGVRLCQKRAPRPLHQGAGLFVREH